MPETTTTAGLKIGRHTAQLLLLEALKHRPAQSSGTFAVDGGEVVAITPFGRERAEAEAAGIYYSSFDSHQPDLPLLARLQREHGVEETGYCLVVALDTEGRMEALAYAIKGGICTPISLELEEDRDLYPVPANG